jgi:hypothetical protein
MAITEGWLKNKGAICICGGDWEVVYSLGNFFYEVDQTFRTVNRIISHKNQPNWLYLYNMITAPRHLLCRRPLFKNPYQGLDGHSWYCDCCGITLSLGVGEADQPLG